MTIIPNFLTAKIVSNLDTYQYTVVNSGVHFASVQLSMIPPSGISVVIQKNGSPVATSSVPAASQSIIDLSASINCVASDTISFVISSSSAIDQGPNDFKALLNVHIGSSN